MVFFFVAFMLPYESYRVQKCSSAQRIVLLVQPQSEKANRITERSNLFRRGYQNFSKLGRLTGLAYQNGDLVTESQT